MYVGSMTCLENNESLGVCSFSFTQLVYNPSSIYNLRKIPYSPLLSLLVCIDILISFGEISLRLQTNCDMYIYVHTCRLTCSVTVCCLSHTCICMYVSMNAHIHQSLNKQEKHQCRGMYGWQCQKPHKLRTVLLRIDASLE